MPPSKESKFNVSQVLNH